MAPAEHRWNPALLNLAERYGFTPKVCRPYRAQTKGKVERFNHYLKNSFAVTGSVPEPGQLTARRGGREQQDRPVVDGGRQCQNPCNHRRKTAAPTGYRTAPLVALARDPGVYEQYVFGRLTHAGGSLQHPLSVYQALLRCAHEPSVPAYRGSLSAVQTGHFYYGLAGTGTTSHRKSNSYADFLERLLHRARNERRRQALLRIRRYSAGMQTAQGRNSAAIAVASSRKNTRCFHSRRVR